MTRLASFVLPASLLIVSSAFAGDITYEGRVIVPGAKTKCEILFRHMAVVAVYCPKDSRPQAILDDLKAVESVTGWPMPLFEVFTDRKRAPKTIQQFNALPDRVPFQAYSISLQNGKVVEKSCYRNAKTVPCRF